MSEELRVLFDVVNRLDLVGVPYMLTGSMALSFYGRPRLTRDVDLVVEIGAADFNKLKNVFEADYYIETDDMREAVQHQGMFNVIHNASLIKIDLIVRKNETYRKTEFARRRHVALGENKVCIVSIEDLILSKLSWAQDTPSDRQLDDVRNLLQNKSAIEFPYLEQWIKTLNLATIYEKVRS